MEDPSTPLSPLSSATPRGRDTDPGGGLGPQPTVVIWDFVESRLQSVSRVVATCGAQTCRLDRFSAVEQAKSSPRCPVALVALGARQPPEPHALEVIRELKRKGFRIICYEDGMESWTLATRCQALLAGSLCSVDSAKPEFGLELSRRLVQLLQAEARRHGEEGRVKRIMNNLGVVGESDAMISVFRRVLRVSPLSDLPTLILGETGTGKELVARAIYQLDPKRRNGPFLALNCGAISPGLAESELFGHRRGAFTGANEDRKGLIRAAEGGILFLDEIGELDANIQAKLLRVLQECRVLGVGEDHEVPVSVRVLAASNRDLDQLTQEGKFRGDLFHRLNVAPIRIPPLRERPEDVRPLVEHFLEKHQALKLGRTVPASPEFEEALTQINFPGNARQLENLVRRALADKEDDSALSLTDLPREIWQQLSDQGKTVVAPAEGPIESQEGQVFTGEPLPQAAAFHLRNLLGVNGWNLSKSLEHCERIFLEAALHQAQGNQSQTARLLGITPRSVYNKVRKHRLPL